MMRVAQRCGQRCGATQRLTPGAVPRQVHADRLKPFASEFCRFVLCPAQPKDRGIHHVHERIPIETLSLGPDDSWYLCESDGDPRGHWADVPLGFLNKLGERAKTLSRVEYAAFTDDSWFVRYDDGTCKWDVSFELEKVLTKGDINPRAVFFGPNSAYVVLGCDGTIRVHNLPDGMNDALLNCGGVTGVAMGPDGEWFVNAEDGRLIAKSLPLSLDREFQDDVSGRGRLLEVQLGSEGTFWAAYENYTMWRAEEGLTEALLACSKGPLIRTS